MWFKNKVFAVKGWAVLKESLILVQGIITCVYHLTFKSNLSLLFGGISRIFPELNFTFKSFSARKQDALLQLVDNVVELKDCFMRVNLHLCCTLSVAIGGRKLFSYVLKSGEDTQMRLIIYISFIANTSNP